MRNWSIRTSAAVRVLSLPRINASRVARFEYARKEIHIVAVRLPFHFVGHDGSRSIRRLRFRRHEQREPGGSAGLSRRSGDPRRRRRSTASIHTRRRCFSPAIAPSKSSARCAFPSSIIRRSASARRPAKRSSPSTPLRAGNLPRRHGDHARSRRPARDRRLRARRSNGRSRCGVSTRSARSIISPARSTTRSPRRSGARSPPRTRRRRRSRHEPWIDAVGPISTNMSRRSRDASGHLPGGRDRRARAREPHRLRPHRPAADASAAAAGLSAASTAIFISAISS